MALFFPCEHECCCSFLPDFSLFLLSTLKNFKGDTLKAVSCVLCQRRQMRIYVPAERFVLPTP